MNLVPTVPAALAGLCLLLAPGLVLLSLLPQRDREALAPDEALYLAVATSVAGSAWLGLVLAEAGRFSLVTAGAVLGGASLLAAVLGRRRLTWPLRRPKGLRELVPAALVLVLAVALQARPSQLVVGGRAPGAHVAAMGIIARTGGLVYSDPVVRSIPPEDVQLFDQHPEQPPFSWSRLPGFDLESYETGRVVPHSFHLFPAAGAYLFQALGLEGALATPVVFGILGSLGVFFTVRRLFGTPTALLTGLALNLNVLQVWFGRYPASEGMSQFLLFLGLAAFAHWEERRSPAFAALAGGALGLSLLVRLDGVLIVIPLGLFLLVRRARSELRWRTAIPLIAPFGLLALHAALHGLWFAPRYVREIVTRPGWRLSAWIWVVLVVLGVVALASAHRGGPAVVRWCESRAAALRAGLLSLLVLLALYAYFLRPWLSAWAGGDGNPAGTALADPAWLHALGYGQLPAHDAQAFVRLGWMLSPVGLALGVLGLASAIRSWRPNLLLPILTAVTLSGFYFYKTGALADYPFAFRRFVPVTVPFLLALGSAFLVRLAARGRLQRGLAALLAVGLMAVYARDTRIVVGHVDWRGTVRLVRDVARYFGPEDIVVFEQSQGQPRLSLPLWAAHGVGVLELAHSDPDPDRLRHLVEAWRDRYRNIYFVHSQARNLCGLFVQRLGEPWRFETTEWSAYDTRLGLPQPRSLDFTVSRVVPPSELRVPPLPEVDIGGSDEFQISGFFGKEGSRGLSYRWTRACASVYLPGAHGGGALTLTAAGPGRPDVARVSVSLSGVPLGVVDVGPRWQSHTLALPAQLPAEPLMLRLDVPAWRPSDADPDSRDQRGLGIMLDRIEIIQEGSRPGE